MIEAEEPKQAILELKCIRCFKAANHADTNPTCSKCIGSREHKVCGNIRRAMVERVRKHAGLRYWWRTATDQEKSDWYCRQCDKGSGGPGRPREWDDTGIDEIIEQGSAKLDREQVVLENYEMFEDRTFPKMLALCDNDAKKAVAKLQE